MRGITAPSSIATRRCLHTVAQPTPRRHLRLVAQGIRLRFPLACRPEEHAVSQNPRQLEGARRGNRRVLTPILVWNKGLGRCGGGVEPRTNNAASADRATLPRYKVYGLKHKGWEG